MPTEPRQQAGELRKTHLKSRSTNDCAVAYVLVSGGIDSAACIAFYLQQGFSVHGLFVSYGQTAAAREETAACAIAEHYSIPLDIIRWSGVHQKSKGPVAGRNAFLLIGALMEIPEQAGVLALGIHSGTDYADCSPSFVNRMQSLFDIYTQGRLRIGAPFLKWKKGDIWTYCKSQAVPVELTYSCELGLDQPCGQCLSCRDLEAMYACS